jgi:hypothetical protein
MVCPCLNPTENASQKGVTFIMKADQKACQMVAFVLSCELLWNPLCTKFIKPNSFLDDSMSTTMSAAQMHDFISSHPSII